MFGIRMKANYRTFFAIAISIYIFKTTEANNADFPNTSASSCPSLKFLSSLKLLLKLSLEKTLWLNISNSRTFQFTVFSPSEVVFP